MISIIAPVIIEMRTLWLVEDGVELRYNYLAQVDSSKDARSLKMSATRFLRLCQCFLGSDQCDRRKFICKELKRCYNFT